MRTDGEINWHGRRVFISEILQGEPVSLEERNDGQWLVCFGPIELGIRDHKGRFHRCPNDRDHGPVQKMKIVTYVPGLKCHLIPRLHRINAFGGWEGGGLERLTVSGYCS